MDYSKQIKSLKAYQDIKDSFMHGSISQAYLFLCPDKLTLSEFLNEVAKLLICENKNGCGVCASCKKIIANTHPDVLIYPKDKNFVTEDAGDIYDKVQLKPMLAGMKVFLINMIDNSTEQAQNKILKIIEEPPENVVFIMSATNPNKVLPTILSRVQKRELDKMSRQEIVNILGEENEINEIAIACGDGYLGKTFSIVNDDEFITNYKNMFNLLKNMKKSDQIPEFSMYFSKNKQVFENSITILSEFLRDVLMINLGCEGLVKNTNLTSELELIGKEFSLSALVNIIRNLNYVRQKMDSNVSLVTLADNMLLELLEVKFLCK